MAKIVFHLKKRDVSSDLSERHLRLYGAIKEMCDAEGIAVDTKLRDPDIKVGTRTVADHRFDDGNLHLIDDRSVRAENVLNSSVAYFHEFWHLDAAGTKAFSSIGGLSYDPASIRSARAKTFSSNFKQRYAGQRRSRYAQPVAEETFPAGAIAVFFQGIYPIQSGATQFTDIDVLLAVQAGAGDRPIIVKPHPKASDGVDIEMALALAKDDARITVTDANVHDILVASVATVSVNSTVALEGFMHGVPAILFGTSDFHHLATTVTKADGLARALDIELAREADFDRYLAWYFLKNCVQLSSPKLHEKIWTRFAAAGFPRDVFHR